MARFSRAIWRGPIPNESPGAMRPPVMGLVLHVEQGTEPGTDGWFHNPGAKASAHFGNPKTGPLDQWVDTADMAWAEVDGNPQWISVEHDGYSGEQLTPSQVENDAQLLAWLHLTAGVPLSITDSPSYAGLGWHGMGGAAWGDHLDCPGAPIVAQRLQIIDRAKQLLGPSPTPQEDEMPYVIEPQGQVVIPTPPGSSGTVWFACDFDCQTIRIAVGAGGPGDGSGGTWRPGPGADPMWRKGVPIGRKYGVPFGPTDEVVSVAHLGPNQPGGSARPVTALVQVTA